MSRITAADKPFKYYEVTATIDGETEVMFGSYDREECLYEVEAERDHWKGQGYKKIKVGRRLVTAAPDPEIYQDIEQPILENASGRSEVKLERVELFDSRFMFYRDGGLVFSLHAGSTNTARLLAHWQNHLDDEAAGLKAGLSSFERDVMASIEAADEPEVIVLRGFDK